MDKKPYLSDVIDYKRDIEPYRIIQIYAGVGSGKNTWVEKLAQEENLHILLITSRKATKKAQAGKLDAVDWIDYEDLMLGGIEREVTQRKVVITNSGLEKFLKEQFDPCNPQTHIWFAFDIIILDEAHSLIEDASFCDSPFHVKAFLAHVYKRYHSSRIVFMTGTPDAITDLLPSKLVESEKVNTLDLRDHCRHVDPQEVVLWPSANLAHNLKDCLDGGNKIIYFSNSIKIGC